MRSFVKKKILSVLCIPVLLGMPKAVLAQQDPQLSQFYAAPLFINPAMAGGSMMPRVMVNYRNQWPSLSANYSTALFSADYYLERFNSGVGLVTMNDSQGFGRLRTTTAALQYAYQIKFNEENSLRLGVEGSYINSGIDTKGLTFGDQFVSGAAGGTRGFSGPTNDPFVKQANLVNINYADVAGGLLYYNPKFWIGGAAHHLNGKRPSYVVGGSSIAMPRKYSVHGGMNFVLTNTAVTRYRRAENEDQDIVLTVAANYKKQGTAQQLDMGAYLVVQPITLGLWYRGIPIVPKTNDAVVALLGFKQDRFSVGYSYDLTVSGLGAGTGGAHEISIRYEFEPPDRYDRMRLKRRKQELSCPKF
jgi:type IX secretion system PorP/SprF family membrane protein